MLTDIVRQTQKVIRNRFELVVVTAERTRQLLLGARPTVGNPGRERLSKVAMREIIGGHVVRDGDGWKVDRPPLPEAPAPAAPASRLDDEDLFLLRNDEEE